MSHYHQKSLAELSAMLQRREISSGELTEHFLARLRQYDKTLNSFITVVEDQAMAQAAAADAMLEKGAAGPLTGVPIAHKDIFCTQGIRTSCGSVNNQRFINVFH